jgi:ribosomal protein S21
MAQDHYRVLGVARNATPTEIKSAYRKLVLVHHPDKSASRESADIFHRATEAYEILGDAERRRHYDTVSAGEKRRVAQAENAKAQQARPQTQTQAKPQPQKAGAAGSKVATVAADVTRLTLIFTRGNYVESEKLARAILNRDNRQPIPYAVLGDLARAKGNLDEAAKMYAYAAQMDPRNPIYQQRHEELVKTGRAEPKTGKSAVKEDRVILSAMVGALLLVSTSLYVWVASEPAIAPAISMISTWTIGLVVMLFLAGVSIGAVMCSGNFLDRFSVSSTNSLGRVSSPILALTSVAVVNFWAAVALYAGISVAQRSFNVSHLRFVGGIAGVVVMLAIACAGSNTHYLPMQTLLWGGNIAYLGGLCGWMIADSFKRV